MAKRRLTVSEIVASVYCEQKVVYDKRFGKATPVHIQRRAAKGTFEHVRFEWEGYTRSPALLVSKLRGSGSTARRPATDSRCFVATHVYGPDAAETNFLRAWRDRALLPSPAGRFAAWLYYAVSPAIVRLMRRYPLVAVFARPVLDHFIRRLGGPR